MALQVDESKCIGCSLCVNMCPHCFESEGDIVKVKAETCSECDLADIAAQCPVEAITIS